MKQMHEVTPRKLGHAWWNKSLEFNAKELEHGLTKIIKGKARDQKAVSAELFHLIVIGADMKSCVLDMLNCINKESIIPYIMKESKITTTHNLGSMFEFKKINR